MDSLTLKSSDGEFFEIDAGTAKCLGVIYIILTECVVENRIYPLDNINSLMLRKLLQWADYHKYDRHRLPRSKESISAWNANFLKVDMETLYELIRAANSIDMQRFLRITRKHFEKMIRLRNAHEIFNIQNYSDLKILHKAFYSINIQCCIEVPLKWGDTEPWGVTARILCNGISEVCGLTSKEIQSRFPSITSIEKYLNWVIDNVNRPFETADNEINAIYTERVLDLCTKKYICTLPEIRGYQRIEDFYTDTILAEGHLSGSLKQTFTDHYGSFKYKHTPYHFASSKFLALSYLLQKNLIDDLENTIENLPKINEFTLATVLQNIEKYLSPFRKLRDMQIVSSRSHLIHVEVDDNNGHYLVIVSSRNEQIISTIKYEVLLYILSSTTNFVCNSITIYNPVIGKKYTTNCNLNRENMN